jgi:hypothetical protein
MASLRVPLATPRCNPELPIALVPIPRCSISLLVAPVHVAITVTGASDRATFLEVSILVVAAIAAHFVPIADGVSIAIAGPHAAIFFDYSGSSGSRCWDIVGELANATATRAIERPIIVDIATVQVAIIEIPVIDIAIVDIAIHNDAIDHFHLKRVDVVPHAWAGTRTDHPQFAVAPVASRPAGSAHAA